MKVIAKFSLVLLTLSALSYSHLTAQESKPAKPISALAWLVGGVWTADASGPGSAPQHIETRYQWSDNQAFLRFTTHFVSDKETQRRYDGNFYWDPAQSSLEMWYMDPANTITQGAVTVDGESTQMAFHGEDFDGKPADFRVTVIRKSDDHYGWALDERQSQGWKRLLALEFFRTAS